MFDLGQFIADCNAALGEEAPQHTIRETMMRALADPAAVLRGLGEPQRAGIQKLFHSDRKDQITDDSAQRDREL